jgi:hypothetical protein
MYRIEVRESDVGGGLRLWEWRIVSRWGVVAREGGGCATEDEARRDGEAAAARLTGVP